jgi:glycosyltransferase involved in cell wall biosynthesis
MNVMEIVSGAGINGAVMHCLLLTRELARRGHAVTLVCRPGAWIGRQLAGAPVAVVESDLSRWPPRELRRVAAIARARRVDVLHTHMSRAHFFGVLLRWWSGLPSVATAHSRHVQLHWMFNDGVIAVSEATRRYHRTRNFVRRRRVEVIHNFVDPARFAAPSAAARATLRAELAIDPTAPLIGVIGAVIPQKGLQYLVEALAQVRASVPQTRLLIVGDRSDRHAAELDRAAERLGVAPAVVWAGHREDIPEILATLDVFVLASLEENLPQSVLEAMAAGVAVVATAVGGVPECVHAGATGLLVPPGDATALAEAIARLLRDADLRGRFGAAGQRRIREQFSAETQVPRIEAALARAISNPDP